MQALTLLLTDLVLGVVAGVFAWNLRRTLSGNKAARWWSRGLGLVAIAAIVGGFHHAFAADFAGAVQWSWWVVTLLLGCSVGLAMDFSPFHASCDTKNRSLVCGRFVRMCERAAAPTAARRRALSPQVPKA
jgi:hypothetical protein